MIPLPPLDCLRFFEAAARHRSFVRASEELGVTPPAVAHRIRMLEGCESRMAVMSAAWFVEFRQRLPWLLHVD